MKLPWSNRPPRAIPPPEEGLLAGESVERGVDAVLLQGKAEISGQLWLTDRRLLFRARKGEARWMIVPFTQARAAGLYPWPRATMGAPRSRQQCLYVETDVGEQVWWDFNEAEERTWLPIVQSRIEAARAAAALEDDDRPS